MISNYMDEKLVDYELEQYINLPIDSIIRGSAMQYEKKVAYILNGESITYGDLLKKSLLFANALKKLGATKGSVVATHMPTCLEYIISYWGIMLIGGIYTPIKPNLPVRPLQYQLNDSKATYIITHESTCHLIEGVYESTSLKKVIVVGEKGGILQPYSPHAGINKQSWFDFKYLLSNSVMSEIACEINPDEDLAHIIYTDYTNNKPKGVMLTHTNLVSNLLQMSTWNQGTRPKLLKNGGLILEPYLKKQGNNLLDHRNVIYNPSPLFLNSGIMGNVIFPALIGAKTILFERFHAKTLLESIEKYRITIISGAPVIWNSILNITEVIKYNLSSVRTINLTTARFTSIEMENLTQMFPNANFCQAYGLIETTCCVALSFLYRDKINKHEAVGLPIDLTEVKIVSIEENCDHSTMLDQVGEIWVKGPQVMKGYLNHSNKTEEVLKDGWYYTGHIGSINKEGSLSIIEKKENLVKYKGFNIYPIELEKLLLEHPAVENAIVIGKVDIHVGEKPKAFVVLRGNINVTENELIDYVNSQVINFMKIRELEFIDEIPTTSSGKLSREAMRERELYADWI